MARKAQTEASSTINSTRCCIVSPTPPRPLVARLGVWLRIFAVRLAKGCGIVHRGKSWTGWRLISARVSAQLSLSKDQYPAEFR